MPSSDAPHVPEIASCDSAYLEEPIGESAKTLPAIATRAEPEATSLVL